VETNSLCGQYKEGELDENIAHILFENTNGQSPFKGIDQNDLESAWRRPIVMVCALHTDQNFLGVQFAL